MGLTYFPNGIASGSEAGGTASISIGSHVVTPLSYEATQYARMVAGTVIVPAAGSTAFIPTGLTAATYAVASAYGPLISGTAGGFVHVTASVAGGTVTLRGYDGTATASSTPGTAVYFAVGT